MDVKAMMSTTANAIFQHAMNKYNENRNEETINELVSSLKNCIYRDASWYVPVDISSEELLPGDSSEALLLKGFPNTFTKLLLKDVNEEKLYWSFYTSENKIKLKDGETLKTVKYSARQFTEDIVDSDVGAGVRINNGTDSIQISLDVFKDILDELSAEGTNAELKNTCNSLVPYGSIDTNEILSSWKNEWNEPLEEDKDPTIEDWELIAYPIQADGTALLIFEMDAEVHGGKVGDIHVTHKVSYFRVLQYDLNGEPKLMGKYRFKIQDGILNTVFFQEGKLKAVIRAASGGEFSVVHMWPGSDDSSQYKVGHYLTNAMMSSSGILFTGYECNFYDDTHQPICSFASDGKFDAGYESEDTMRCSAMTFDKNEDVWFHMFPSSQIVRLDVTNRDAKHTNVQLQGFSEMAFTNDLNYLYTAYIDSDTETLIYRMRRSDSGYYGPKLQKICIADDNGEIVDPTDCDVYGNPSMMKNKMLFNVDGVLWAFDFDKQA